MLRGSTVVRNPTRQAITAQVNEVVPKSIAADVDDQELTPAPDEVVQRSPIVR